MARIQRQIAKPKPVEPSEILRLRPRRPILNTEPTLISGGWVKNPPEECKHKKKDKDGFIWVESVMCAHICKAKCEIFTLVTAKKKKENNHGE